MAGLKKDVSFAWAKTAIQSLNLEGKKLAVVGGTDGLGRAIAQAAAARGAQVTVSGRTNRDPPGNERIRFIQCDLSLMRNAVALAAQLETDYDVLLLTAGILAAPKRQETREGLERDMAVSYLSRLALLNAYVPRLASAPAGSPPLRVFNMGFPGAGQAGVLGDLNSDVAANYKALPVHMNTVAGNEALITYANAKWGTSSSGRAVEVYGLNPGLIRTSIRENFLGTGILARIVEWLISLFNISPETYAATITPLLFAPELSGRPGLLFNQAGGAILPTPALRDAESAATTHAKQLMVESQLLVERGLAAKLADA